MSLYRQYFVFVLGRDPDNNEHCFYLVDQERKLWSESPAEAKLFYEDEATQLANNLRGRCGWSCREG